MPKQEPAPATPPEESADNQQFVVMHSMVGTYYRGQTITVEHLKAGEETEVDVARLLRVGAIAPVGTRTAEDLLAEYAEDAKTVEGTPVHGEVPLPPLSVNHPKHPSKKQQASHADLPD